MSRRVVIVGGGFSGAATAAALLRRGEAGLRVALIERSGVFGRGVAYSTTRGEHLLNVAAGKMSALPDEPGHFVGWARAAGHDVGEHDFVPRALYGDYVQALLGDAERAAPAGTLERIAGEVTAISPRPAGEGAGGVGPRATPDGERTGALVSIEGRRLEADALVLALGVSRPAQPPFAAPAADHPGYVADPWDAAAIARLQDARSVIVLGTGMTMADVVLTLGGGVGGPDITALSRRGELPRAHRIDPAARVPEPVVRPRPGLTADALAAAVERAARDAGEDWRGVVDSLRPVTPELWRSLAPREQARFARVHARRWEVHRSRLAPAAAARIDELRAAGALRIEAADVRSLAPAGDGRIACEAEGHRTFVADAVVNAAGPAWDCRRGEHALLRDLISRGLAAPGPLGLGLRTADDGALIDAAGRASDVLFTLGALRRGELWESVAVPELAAQACALAERVCAPARALVA